MSFRIPCWQWIIHLIYILATEAGGLALIVKEKVVPVWLPKLTTGELSEKLKDYLDKYSKRQKNQPEWLTDLEHITQWLWDAVMGPVIEAIPFGAKVTLIPSGLLALLPLHGAWKEDKASPTGKYYALDALDISYSPNARSFAEARAIASSTRADKMLAVADPVGDLPNSEYEFQGAVSFFEHKVLRHEHASCEAILNDLPYYNMLHFSCHGRADFVAQRYCGT